MRYILLFLFLFPPNLFSQETTKYIIKSGDTLEVFVPESKEFSRDVIVGNDGSIDLPIIKNVKAEGLTTLELEKELAKRLRVFIKEPIVSVYIKRYKQVSILGEIARPGPYEYRAGMRILDLVSQAGGFTDKAVLSKVKVMRDNELGERQIIIVNVKDALKKGIKEKDIPLLAGDIIYVSRTGVAWWNWTISNVFPTLSLISSMAAVILIVTR